MNVSLAPLKKIVNDGLSEALDATQRTLGREIVKIDASLVDARAHAEGLDKASETPATTAVLNKLAEAMYGLDAVRLDSLPRLPAAVVEATKRREVLKQLTDDVEIVQMALGWARTSTQQLQDLSYLVSGHRLMTEVQSPALEKSGLRLALYAMSGQAVEEFLRAPWSFAGKDRTPMALSMAAEKLFALADMRKEITAPERIAEAYLEAMLPYAASFNFAGKGTVSATIEHAKTLARRPQLLADFAAKECS